MSRKPKQGSSSRSRSLTPTAVEIDNDSVLIPLCTQSTHSTSSLSLADRVLPPRHPPRLRVHRAWIWSKSVIYNSRGLLLVLLSQFFGSTMSLCTRVLEASFPEQKMHAMQILFFRQSVTTVVVGILIVSRSVEHAPWGPLGVRWLLLARGFGGFFGVFGLYYSLAYLDLSDAAVITFLEPIVTTLACSLIPYLNESFTKTEFLASIFSLFGVVLIARPTSLFSRDPTDSPDDPSTVHSPPTPRSLLLAREIPTVTPHQRLIAVLVALFGVLGISTAFTTIRWIGHRAHALIVMIYFSLWCCIISLTSSLLIPSIGGLIWPHTLLQWALLLGVGISGFGTQYFLTLGLQVEKAGRATNMVYTQMLFALVWERIVWGTTPGWGSLVGSGCILGSVLWVGLKKAEKLEVAKERAVDEEVGLMSRGTEGEEGEGDEWMEMEDRVDVWGLDGDEDREDEEDESEDESGESGNIA
ncbi:unnamed protein product [Tuber melanosporum]|uniref:(Perigord truffle) hypothetical protein n=1 Tax=Tuber melanosporum (strain Mel28) TaxID=656061 RepID=D5GHY4_TUBMM|nr:uncharacterized protein GSTUM_00008185001 [Tuber melanosporum]CAZ84127.1 unnamed protein product [Tuber melanosporum]